MINPVPLDKIRILVITANPTTTKRLRLEEERREIIEKILVSTHRDRFDIRYAFAARPEDLLETLNLHRPHIVHYSGHTNKDGEILLLDDDGTEKPVNARKLKKLFALSKDTIRMVVLNSCRSRTQADAISGVIECVIGMNSNFDDQAAVIFASRLYQSLGFGNSLLRAFQEAKLAIDLKDLPGYTIPRLLCGKGVNPSRIFFVMPQEEIAALEMNGKLTLLESALTQGDFVSVSREIDDLPISFYAQLSPPQQAKFKYIEVFACLRGKRPYTLSFDSMNVIEGFMQQAIRLHHIYSYKCILAVFKYDFAHPALQKNRQEADRLIREAQKLLPLKVEDYENFNLLLQVLPNLYQEYLRYFKQFQK